MNFKSAEFLSVNQLFRKSKVKVLLLGVLLCIGLGIGFGIFSNPVTAQITSDIIGRRFRVIKSDLNNAAVIELSNGFKTNYIFTDGPSGDLYLRTDNVNYDVLLQTGGRQGNVGIGNVNPKFPLQMGSGAYVSFGGVWTNASSRDYKEDISALPLASAKDTLQQLNPVTFAYKADKTEKHVGFIAEDVPALVATKDRKGLSSMDVVAVLTKVVQEQEKAIDKLERKVEALSNQGTDNLTKH